MVFSLGHDTLLHVFISIIPVQLLGSTSDFAKAVTCTIEQEENNRNILMQTILTGLIDPSHAIQKIVDILPDFIDKKPRNEWVVIPRDKTFPEAIPHKVMQKISALDACSELWKTTNGCYEHRPDSLLLFALALHASRLDIPQASIAAFIYKKLQDLFPNTIPNNTSIDSPSMRYNELPAKLIKMVYLMAFG